MKLTEEQEKFISEYMPIHIKPLTTVECVRSGMRIAFEHANKEKTRAITEERVKFNEIIIGLQSDLRVCVEVIE